VVSLRVRAEAYFESLQDEICAALERVDGAGRFREDRWLQDARRADGTPGGGTTRVLTGGRVFEKAGVNTSAVRGVLSQKLAARMNVPPSRFFATGVSLVAHPLSPMVPVVHMNLRYLELADGDAWFGGGADLTPCYLERQDAEHFHRALKAVCDRHDPSYHPRFKRWCDEYFFIAHRGETRGIGGIFFDYLRDDPERVFAFVRDVGGAFLGAYLPIVERRKGEPWTDRERQWQLVRRARYVEFNLVYDRGTLFGLETGGRTESILMSLPPVASWNYDYQPEPDSREAELVEVLRAPVAWV
jgi:coproporphyrinogen III oxidase